MPKNLSTEPGVEIEALAVRFPYVCGTTECAREGVEFHQGSLRRFCRLAFEVAAS